MFLNLEKRKLLNAVTLCDESDFVINPTIYTWKIMQLQNNVLILNFILEVGLTNHEGLDKKFPYFGYALCFIDTCFTCSCVTAVGYVILFAFRQ